VRRSGFVALAGRPNVGKSTLVNRVVGEKVAITSDRAQTTRRAIRGVAQEGDSQLVLIDLPGFQRPRDRLTERMQARVEYELAESDAALMMVNGEEGVGPGDRYIASLLGGARLPVVLAVNKCDRLDRGRTVAALAEAAALDCAEEIFPVSARTGEGVPELARCLAGLMPEGPYLFPPDAVSDQPTARLVAELIREQAIRRTFEEVPHSVEVVVEEMEPSGDALRVRALLWVETESQKGILVGRAGRMVKAIGTSARREIEGLLGEKVHLDLSVRVRGGWRGDDGLLDRLGID
jgi:GTP-binding protein Era